MIVKLEEMMEFLSKNSDNNSLTLNLLYIKSYKTASSTAEGINIQIAHNGKY